MVYSTLNLLLTVILSSLWGCQGIPASIESLTNHLGLQSTPIQSQGFTLETAINRSAWTPDRVLHVYLEGDGLPWVHRNVKARDPTPMDALMLRLMAIDTKPSLYLGRPCYFGHAEDAGCNESLWTEARYSQSVVDAMAQGLNDIVNKLKVKRLILIGHSGGAALALLIANRIQKVTKVITLAGNLDPESWAQWHGFSALVGSLNPSKEPKTHDYDEVHLLAQDDENIPLQSAKEIALSRENSQVIVLVSMTHTCCWEEVLPIILSPGGESPTSMLDREP